MYAQDNNDRLPGDAWMDRLSLYEGDDVRFSCPVQRRTNPLSYGYAFSKDLLGTPLKKIQDATKKEMIFDSSLTARNATGDLSSLPSPGRHHQGRKNVIVYADGHADSIERLGP